MNNTFAEYVTSSAFNISLSSNMIACLTMTANDQISKEGADTFYFNGRNAYVQHVNGLMRRGLVEHNPILADHHGGPIAWSEITWTFRLTKAGELVFELLKEAGLVHVMPEKKGAVSHG